MRAFQRSFTSVFSNAKYAELSHRVNVMQRAFFFTESSADQTSSREARTSRFAEYAGKSSTVRVRHPDDASREAIQQALEEAVGERALRIVTPRDKETGFPLGYSYVVLSSPQSAVRAVERAVFFAGERFDVGHAKDVAYEPRNDQQQQQQQQERPRKERARFEPSPKLYVRIPSGLTLSDAVQAVEQVTGEKAISVTQPEPTVPYAFLLFSSVDVSKKAIDQAPVASNGENVFVDFAEHRSPQAKPTASSLRRASPAAAAAQGGSFTGSDEGKSEAARQRQDRYFEVTQDELRGHVCTVYTRGLPLGTTKEDVMQALMKASGGVRPVRLFYDEDERYGFAEMQLPEHAVNVTDAGLNLPGGNVPAFLAPEKHKIRFGDLAGKTSRLYLGAGNRPFFADADLLTEVLMKEFGETPTRVTCLQNFAYCDVSTPEAATRIVNAGLSIHGHPIKVRYADSLAELPSDVRPSSSVYLGGLPKDVSDAQLSEIVVNSTNIKPKRAMIVRDPSTRRGLGYGFLDFETTEDAEAFVKKGDLEVDGVLVRPIFSNRGNRPAPQPSRVVYGSNLPGNTSAEELSNVLFEAIGERPTNVRLLKHGTAIFTLSSVEVATSLIDKNVVVGDTVATFSYAVEAATKQAPKKERRFNRDDEIGNKDMEGKTAILFLAGFPPGRIDVDALKQAISSTSGVVPVRVYPNNRGFAFANFGSSEDAKTVAQKGVSYEGRSLRISYARDNVQQKSERKD